MCLFTILMKFFYQCCSISYLCANDSSMQTLNMCKLVSFAIFSVFDVDLPQTDNTENGQQILYCLGQCTNLSMHQKLGLTIVKRNFLQKICYSTWPFVDSTDLANIFCKYKLSWMIKQLPNLSCDDFFRFLILLIYLFSIPPENQSIVYSFILS